MSQKIQNKIRNKIQEDISPTRNLSGAHLKIVLGIAILWTLFKLWRTKRMFGSSFCF